MELYGLDCVDLVVSYTIQFLFIAKKCKFSKNHLKPPDPRSFQQIWTDRLLRKKQKKPTNFVKQKGTLKSESTLNCVGKETAAALSGLKRLMTLHFLDTLD